MSTAKVAARMLPSFCRELAARPGLSMLASPMPIAYLALAASLFCATPVDPNNLPFRLLHNADGVSVWERTLPGVSRAQFRARAILQAPAINIVAVILDVEHTRSWNDNCKENYILESKGPGHHYAYNHNISPAFFLSERDLVVEYRLQVLPEKHAARVYFNNIDLPQMPPKQGVVRMPYVAGFYEVRELDSTNTEVTYDITADPGGWVPDWIVDWASKRLIGGVMQRLGVQAHAPMYAKLVEKLHRSLDWQGFAEPVLYSNAQ